MKTHRVFISNSNIYSLSYQKYPNNRNSITVSKTDKIMINGKGIRKYVSNFKL